MVPSTRAIGCNVRDSMKLNSQLNIIKTPQQGYGGGKQRELTVATFEVDHEIGQSFNAFQRHRVINRGAHAPHHTVAFQRVQTCREGLFQGTRCPGCCLPAGTARSCGSGWLSPHRYDRNRSLSNHAVQQLSFLLINLVHLRHTAVLLQPFEDQAREVPGKRRRGVEHGVVIVQHGVSRELTGRIYGALPSRSSRTMTIVRPAGPIFFCAPCIDNAVAADINRGRKNGGGESRRQPQHRLAKFWRLVDGNTRR